MPGLCFSTSSFPRGQMSGLLGSVLIKRCSAQSSFWAWGLEKPQGWEGKALLLREKLFSPREDCWKSGPETGSGRHSKCSFQSEGARQGWESPGLKFNKIEIGNGRKGWLTRESF